MFRSSQRPTRLRVLADEDLIERARNGDAAAFEVVFERHVDPAFSLAIRMCGQHARAEDVVQEAFLSLWRRTVAYDRARGSVRSWILAAVHNKAIDSFRRLETKEGRDIDDDQHVQRQPAHELTEVEVEQRDDAHRVRSSLLDLPTDQRRVIELAYFGNFSQSEIGDMLELAAGTVKGRMRLGLNKLRISLGSGGVVR